jgi:Mrp family chromosome partitioning ATPase
VTAPLADDRSRYEPGSLRAANLRGRRPPSQSLALSRLRRGAHRQYALFCVVALTVAAGGVVYDYFGGVELLTAAAFWAPLGVAVGLAAALMSELSRNTVTSLSSLGRHRGYSVLGAAPELTPRMLRQLPPDKRSPLGCLAFQPASPFATAFRDLQSAVADDNLVSFVAALPEEGATTAALCTAVAAAQQGRSVIVVDCDVRRRALTRALDYEPEFGVQEASDEPDAWREFVDEEPETGLHFMPAARARNPWRSLVGAPGFPHLIDNLRRAYDLVVLDCPPALGSADGPVLAGLADKVVVVTAWDRTPLNVLRGAMRSLRRRSHARTGVYVNRVPSQYRFGRLRPD